MGMHDGVVVMIVVKQGIQGSILVQHQVNQEEQEVEDNHTEQYLWKNQICFIIHSLVRCTDNNYFNSFPAGHLHRLNEKIAALKK
jgi:hypothetical protein